MSRHRRSVKAEGELVRMSDVFQDAIRLSGRQMGVQDMRLLLHWEAAVGTDCAEISYPIKLSRGILQVGVQSANAPTIDMLRPTIVAMVNRFLGREAVTDVILKQSYTIPRAKTPAPSPRILTPVEDDPDQDIAPLEGFSDPELGRSCARLMRAIQRREANERTRPVETRIISGLNKE